MFQNGVSDQHIDVLLERLSDKSEKMRIQTVEELTSAYPGIEDPGQRALVGSAVLKAMSDKSWPVRQAATLILQHICEPWAAEPLVNALTEFRHPELKDSKITKTCYEELGKALVRVGAPALEAMIQYYMTNEDKFKRFELMYWDSYPAMVVHTYFEIMGEVAADKLVSMISTQANNDKVFHLLVNCGKAAEKPLLEFIKKQGLPSPVLLFSDDNELLMFRGLGAAALLGNKVDEPYQNDIQARIDSAKGSLALPTPKLEEEYKELFYGKHVVSPILLILVVLRMEDSNHYREALVSILQELGQTALEAILPDLTGSFPVRAAELLGNLGHPAAIEPLASRLAKPDTPWGLRRIIVQALGKIGGASVPEIILPYLKDPEGLVRSATAEVLGDLKDEQATPALVETLNDKAWEIRLAAVQALGKIGDARAVPGLIERLSDKGGKFLGMGKGVREFAGEALEQIGTPEALQAVREMKAKKR